MEERYYLITVTVASGGGENRVMTPYDDKDTALRKFHEAFNSIGAGPQYIAATILEKSQFAPIKTEVWKLELEPETNEE